MRTSPHYVRPTNRDRDFLERRGAFHRATKLGGAHYRIPLELYEAVAIVIGYVLRVGAQKK